MARLITRIAMAATASIGMYAAAILPAQAQSLGCGARADIVGFLSERFGERPIGVGLIGDHTAFELHVSDSGSWTILATGTDGSTCMVAAGEGWTRIDESRDEMAGMKRGTPAGRAN